MNKRERARQPLLRAYCASPGLPDPLRTLPKGSSKAVVPQSPFLRVGPKLPNVNVNARTGVQCSLELHVQLPCPPQPGLSKWLRIKTHGEVPCREAHQSPGATPDVLC